VYLTETTVSTFFIRNELMLGPGLLTVDAERREDNLQNASTTPKFTRRSQDAQALGYGVRVREHSIQFNARHDDDSEFGHKSTGAFAYGYALTSTLRATASIGTAFRVPTLYQRFSVYGSPSLKPESSENKEVGLRWQSGVDRVSIVAYHNDVENLINYVSGASSSCPNGAASSRPGCYFNTGHARLSGWTLAGATQVDLVNLSASLDWMNPINVDNSKVLARRARKQAVLAADMPVAQWRLGGELQHVGERYDDANNTIRLAAYNLVNLTASRPIDRDWRILARVNNLTDKDYVLANGYVTPGRHFYVGLTWAPQR
jgi:vitamin B12 transporter